MKKIFLLSIFLLLLSDMGAFAQDMPVSEFVRKLESRYYNPLRCGLADYHCEIDDALLENLISALSKGHPANKPLFRKMVGLNAQLRADSTGITITGSSVDEDDDEKESNDSSDGTSITGSPKSEETDKDEDEDSSDKDDIKFNLVAEWAKLGVKAWDDLSFSFFGNHDEAFFKSVKIKKTIDGYEVTGKEDKNTVVYYFRPNLELEKAVGESKDTKFTMYPRYAKGPKGWRIVSCRVEYEDILCLIKVTYRKVKGFDLPGTIGFSFGTNDGKGSLSQKAIVITDTLVFKGYQAHLK